MALYKDRGVVLGGFRLGEADKVLTLLTEERGLVRAVAKGVRKTKSRFGGRLEPLSHVAALFYQGRSLDVVSQVEVITPWPRLRVAPDRLGTGLTLAEAAQRVSHEHEPAPRLYRLLTAGLAGLDALDPHDPVPPLYVTVYLLRLLEVAGFAFATDACASCGSPDPCDRVGIAEGGLLCPQCRTPSAFRVSFDTLALLRGLSRGRVAETARAAGAPVCARETAALIQRFAEYHLEARLRSVSVTAAFSPPPPELRASTGAIRQ